MNYEQKYKAALDWMQSVYPTMTGADKEDAEHYFPELKESEDERIRKGLIKAVSGILKGNTLYGTDVTREEALAWLEKQGEQKSADKVEPKFHEGEWIIHQGTENIYQVIARIDNQYQLKYGDNYTVQKCTDVDRCARLWTIADAKDGDVLVHNGYPFIFMGVKDGIVQAYYQGMVDADKYPRWISVEDELPPTSDKDDESDDYLIVDSDGDKNVGYYNKMDELWFSCDGYILDVTHWMPLPEAPKEGGKE